MKKFLKFCLFPLFMLAVVIITISRVFFQDLPKEILVKTVLYFLDD